MWLHNGYVATLIEFASNKLLLSIESELLVVEKWEPLRQIPSLVKGNMGKEYILPHPDFDQVKLPFLVCSGFDFITLINVKEYRIEKFIDQSCC